MSGYPEKVLHRHSREVPGYLPGLERKDTMNNELIDTIRNLALQVAEAQYDVDALEIVLKTAIEEEERNRVWCLYSEAGDRAKELSSSSTVAARRKFIETDILGTADYKPLHNLDQLRYDKLAAEQRLRQLRADHTAATMRFYAAFADRFGTMQQVFSAEALTPAAGRVLPIVPTPVR